MLAVCRFASSSFSFALTVGHRHKSLAPLPQREKECKCERERDREIERGGGGRALNYASLVPFRFVYLLKESRSRHTRKEYIKKVKSNTNNINVTNI